MNDDKDEFHQMGLELSDREVFLIGKVIVQWGALEHEVFTQTIVTFDASEGEQTALPRAMNNLQFTELLGLWKARVVDHAQGERGKVLQRQFDTILQLKDFRDALVHGMWDWSPADLAKISTVRIRKKEIITTHFTADDLDSFAASLASINFKIRFPGGLEDFARKRTEQGLYISRRGLSLMTDNRVASDWLSSLPQPKGESKE